MYVLVFGRHMHVCVGDLGSWELSQGDMGDDVATQHSPLTAKHSLQPLVLLLCLFLFSLLLAKE